MGGLARLGTTLRRLDAKGPWGALGRVVLTTLALFPWDWRFLPSPFDPKDVEPWILALAKVRGVDLGDPSQWHSPFSLGLRVGLFILAVGLGWWGLARFRRRMGTRTFQTGWRFLLAWALLVGCTVVLGKVALPAAPSGFPPHIPVWGGWVESWYFMWPYPLTRLAWVLLAAFAVEGLLLLTELGHRLRESQDLALRARLAPHFLLNSFNTLIAQIEENPREAAATAERLSNLFRQVMEATRAATVPLRQELAFAEDVLALARDRFGERLKVEVDVPEELLDLPVPVLGLQVLVENALKHGVEPRKAGGLVRIEARPEGRGLRLAVEDPGNGTPGEVGSGTSLEALRQRLRRPKDLEFEVLPGRTRVSFSWQG